MSNQLTLWDTNNAIFSEGSPAGRSHSASPDGQKTGKSGPCPVPASLSARPAKAKRKTTPATSGPKVSDSSASVARKPFSASKSHPQKLSARSLKLLSLTRFKAATSPEQIELQTRLSNAIRSIFTAAGSMEYRQTWQARVTPAGLRLLEHTASARPTSGSDCIGWPTTKAKDGKEWSPNAPLDSSSGHGLGAVAQLVPWVSPTAQDGSRGSLPPRPQDTGKPLSQQVAMLSPWATASSRDWKDSPGMSETGTNPDGTTRGRLDQLPRQAHGLISKSSNVATEKRGAFQLNPSFSRWLMGFPAAWDSCGATAMQLCRKSRRNSSPPT